MPKDSSVAEYKYVVRLPGDLREALHERAEEEDRPIARIVRSALRRYLGLETAQA
jgi:predicted transcriptional regulator